MSEEERDRPQDSGEEEAPTPEQPDTPEAAADAADEGTAPGSAPDDETPVPADGPTEDEVAAKAREEAEEKAKAAAAAKAKAEAAAKAKAAKAAAEAAKPPWARDPATPEWEDSSEDPLVAALNETHGDAVESARTLTGDLTLQIRREAIAEVAESLKADHGYTYLVDLCGADYPDDELRFEVVYYLHRFEDNRRVRLKVRTDEATEVPTVAGVWRAANWPEREVYDMYGVRFADHPDMTRILLWEGFNGYPLRKDFPVEGIDTGSAIYPEYYGDEAGPVAGTGTGWKPPEPPEPEPEAPEEPAEN